MQISLPYKDLLLYIQNQLNNFFPDKVSWDKECFEKAFDIALQRAGNCFNHITLPYYQKNGNTHFSHMHTDQYAMFIYLLSNTVWNEYKDELLASKLMYLNKSLHSINCMYDTELPEIFVFIHCVGTVIGKAKYGNYLAVYQGVTIGTHDGETPIIGDYVSLLPGSAVVGKCIIGNKVSIGLGTKIYKTDVEDNHIAITNKSGEIIIKPSTRLYSDKLFSYDK